jgi:hypothetical protein
MFGTLILVAVMEPEIYPNLQAYVGTPAVLVPLKYGKHDVLTIEQ